GLRLTLTTTGRSWFTGDPTSDSSGRIAAVPNLPNDDATIGPSLAGTRLANTPGGGARTPASRRLAPGSIIAGRYRLVALLGRGGCRRPRSRRPASRSEAGQRDDRRRRERPDHRFRPRGRRRRRRGGASRYAAVHGAGAARRPAREHQERHLRPRPRAVRDLHRTARVRSENGR